MSRHQAKILIIDDDPTILKAAKLFLKQKFTYVHTLETVDELAKVITDINFDLVLMPQKWIFLFSLMSVMLRT